MAKKNDPLPYVVEKRTLHDRVRGTNSNYLVWEKNIKTARKNNPGTDIYDEIKVRPATEEDIEKYG